MRMTFLAACLAASVLASAPALAESSNIVASIEGVRQGAFKPDSNKEKYKERIQILSFSHTVKSPRDASSGLATGKRQHGPVVIRVRASANLPQFYQALVTNESLKTVSFDFFKINQMGVEDAYQTVRLTNAYVQEILLLDTPIGVPAKGGDKGLGEVEIKLSFQKIEIENRDGKTVFADDLITGKQ